jgi:hypothetical protein
MTNPTNPGLLLPAYLDAAPNTDSKEAGQTSAVADLAGRLGRLPFGTARPLALPGYVPPEAMPLVAGDLGALASDHATFGHRGFGVVYDQVALTREDLTDPDRVAECLAAGGTAVLSSVNRFLPTLRRLCEQVSR